MTTKWFFLLIFLCSINPVVANANRDEGMTPAEGFFIPKGDATRGKKSFADLKCTACHWVANEADLSKGPVAEKLGPMLGSKQAAYAKGWLLNSIVSPSHTIAIQSDGQSDNSELSRMGDFREVMTVKQLFDIVEYLKSVGEPKNT